MPELEELQRQIDEIRVMSEDALDKFPIRSTTTPGAGKERHIHNLGKHPGGVIAASAYNDAAIQISDDTETALTFNKERYDTDIIHSTSSNTGRLTAKTAGKYHIGGNAQWAADPANATIYIKLNGSTFIAQQGLVADYRVMNIGRDYDLAVDDYVELVVKQVSGGAININATSNISPEFWMSRVGAAGTAGGGAPGTDHDSLTGRGGDGHTAYILAAGTRAFTGEQSMGTNKLTDVVDPTSNQDAATKAYHDVAATTSAKGIAELATVAEANTGTDTGRVCTPDSLGSPIRTITLLAQGGAPTTTSGCSEPTKVEAGTNDVDYWVLDFDDGSDEYAFWGPIAMPENYGGGTFTARFYWTTTATDADGVAWAIQLLSLDDGDPIDSAWGTAVVTTDDAQSAAGDELITDASAAITPGGTASAPETLCIRVFRDVSDGNDDMTEDARLTKVKLEYSAEGYSD